MDAFVVFVVLFCVAGFIFKCWQEANPTPEQREEAHYRRMLEIEREHHQRERRGQIGATLGKLAVGIAVSALTGQSHKHH